MFVFAICLISKQVCRDWARVEMLLNGTLESIFNSKNKSFKVYIACHEIPETSYNNDPRLEYIQVDFPPMMGNNRPMVDKILKYKAIGVRAKQEHDECYLMLMDADDLVSNRLVDYVYRKPDKYGYAITKGFEYDFDKKKISTCPRFNLLCGSSIILHVYSDDLPDQLNVDDDLGDTYYETIIYNGHRESFSISKDIYNRPLRKIPFRAGIYIINNGENHTNRTSNIGVRRKLLRFLLPQKEPGKSIKEEYSLY